jgi:hypothetical protein
MPRRVSAANEINSASSFALVVSELATRGGSPAARSWTTSTTTPRRWRILAR